MNKRRLPGTRVAVPYVPLWAQSARTAFGGSAPIPVVGGRPETRHRIAAEEVDLAPSAGSFLRDQRPSISGRLFSAHGQTTNLSPTTRCAPTPAMKFRIATLKRLLPRISLRQAFSVALPLGLFLTFVVSVGPFLQAYVFSAVEGNAPTIYEAAYRQGMPSFPSLDTWLSNAWTGVWISALAVVASLYTSRLLETVAVLAGTVCALFVASDFVQTVQNGPFDLQFFLLNVAGDLLGSILIAGLTLAGLALYRLVVRTAIFSAGVRSALAGGLILLLGVTLSTAAYFLLAFVYRPLPTDIRLTAVLPLHGTLRRPDEPTKANEPGEAPFSVFPNTWVQADLRSINPESKAVLSFKRLPAGSRYAAELRAYTNCDAIALDELPAEKPYAVVGNLDSLSLMANGAAVTLGVRPTQYAKFFADANGVADFWISKSGRPPIETLTYFLGPGDDVRAALKGGAQIGLEATLFSRESSHAPRPPYILTLSANGVAHSFQLRKATLSGSNRPLRCMPFTPRLDRSGFGGGDAFNDLPSDTVSVTILVKLKSLAPVTLSEEADGDIKLSSVNGWTSLTQIKEPLLSTSQSGKLGLLIISTGLKSLTIDGATKRVKVTDNLWALGDLGASITEDGDLEVAGTADRTWLNGRRLNQTRWEHFPDAWRLPLFGSLFAGLAWLLNAGRGFLRRRWHEDVWDWG